MSITRLDDLVGDDFKTEWKIHLNYNSRFAIGNGILKNSLCTIYYKNKSILSPPPDRSLNELKRYLDGFLSGCYRCGAILYSDMGAEKSMLNKVLENYIIEP